VSAWWPQSFAVDIDIEHGVLPIDWACVICSMHFSSMIVVVGQCLTRHLHLASPQIRAVLSRGLDSGEDGSWSRETAIVAVVKARGTLLVPCNISVWVYCVPVFFQ
jgi:hypothetical protein